MADEVDMANAKMEMELESLRLRRMPEPPAIEGKCLWCDQSLPAGLRFCDADCRDDYQKYVK